MKPPRLFAMRRAGEVSCILLIEAKLRGSVAIFFLRDSVRQFPGERVTTPWIAEWCGMENKDRV